MVFTIQQTTAFFEEAAQMAIPHETRVQLATEGIDTVDDLGEFDEDNLKQIADNLRRPSGRVPIDPINDPNGATMATPAFVFGAKSHNRLKAASDLVRYYETVGRDLTAANMRWNPTIKLFNEHWKSLVERKKDDRPETPKITRGLPVVKWTEAFRDFLNRVIGSRHIPLVYLIRDVVDVPAAPLCATGLPHAEEFGSVEAELIARATHTHPLFRDDNALLYYLLEEATRGTSYSASIKPFQRTKNGRSAFLAMLSQYAGEDKWRALIKQAEDMLHNRKWKGQQTNYSLEKFIGQHRTAFVNMSQCATHINYQLPNANSRVTYLLSALECMHPPLQAAMALIRSDQDEDGKMNDFEATASFLLPHDPVANKRSNDRKRPSAEISEVTFDIPSDDITKARVGKTGVEFRFHTKPEYSELSDDQRKELNEYRDARETKGLSRKLPKVQGRGGKQSPNRSPNKDFQRKPGNKKMKSMIAAAVTEALKKDTAQAQNDATVDQQFQEYIAALVDSAKKQKNNTTTTTAQASSTTVAPPPAVSLNSILGRMKK
jgi:hypothetical protein